MVISTKRFVNTGKETTTPIPTTTTEPPPKPFPWKAVAGAVGGFLGLLMTLWCCWRPGYLPWRLSRLRNAPIFNTQRCVCCRRGPTVCCPCFKVCAGDVKDDADYGKYAVIVQRCSSLSSAIGPNFNGPVSTHKLRPSS